MFDFESPFFYVRGSSMDSMFWIPRFGNKAKESLWFKIFYIPLYNMFYKMNRMYWWFAHRYIPKHKYHLIDTKMKPGYHDECSLILHGCMAMVERYIECHDGVDALAKFNEDLRDPTQNEHLDMTSDQANRQEEAILIYKWWKIDYPKDLARIDELTSLLFAGKGARANFVQVKDSEFFEYVPTPFTDEEEKIYAELRALETKVEEDEQKMLHRLIDIREGLWS